MFGLNREREVLVTALLDALILGLAWVILTGWNPVIVPFTAGFSVAPTPFASFGLHYTFWLTVLTLAGLYRKIFLISRFDEFLRVGKASVLGTVALFLALLFSEGLDSQITPEQAAYGSIPYGLFVGSMIYVNRFVIRTIQRHYARSGKGLHRAVIVGTGKTALSVYSELDRFKTMGMQVLGFLHVNGQAKVSHPILVEESKVLGNLAELRSLIDTRGVQDVIVALEPEQRDDLITITSQMDYPEISLKLLPDFYQLVGGLNKTNQIFGLPLVDILGNSMPLWERAVKRILDVVISALFLVVLSPVLLVTALAVALTSKGPIIYRQERVGRNGKVFTIFKFRTMVVDAEQESGPRWATDNDPRVTKAGYWMRKFHLDEVPQFINVLKGDMSLVGPRPERPFFVNRFKNEIPLYGRRLRVRPGITGWAQVKWKYDASFDDVVEKTKFDLFYVENISLRMDFKILINTVITVLGGHGK